MIEMKKARKVLAIIWFGGGLVFVMIMVVQSILGKYQDKTDEAWAWLLPTIMPTLSLIVAVLGAEALGRATAKKVVNRFMYQLTSTLSFIYLLVVSLTVLLAPFSPTPPLELMRMSNLWLGPLQGLVGGALGVFFVSKEPKDSHTVANTAGSDA